MTEDTAPRAIDTIELELLTLVRLLETLGRRSSLYDRVDRSGYLMLRTLDRRGPSPTTALADALGLDASTVTRQANALVRDGFIERRPNPDDGRSSNLALTALGARTMRHVEAGRREVLGEMFDGWSETERRTLGRSLTKLNQALVGQVAQLGRQRQSGAPPSPIWSTGRPPDGWTGRRTGGETVVVTKVAVLDDYQQVARGFADWASLGPDVEVTFFHQTIDQDDLAATLSDFDVLVLMRERTAFRQPVLEQLSGLRLLVTTGMSNASVDIGYLNQRGVVVAGTGGRRPSSTPGVPSTTEVAWALILAVAKRVTIEDRAMRQGHWQLDLPTNLAGATLGLAGLGNLGASMVAPARAFGMDVIAWSQNLTDERAAEVGATRVTKAELLARSDVLSIHLVLSDRTRGLFAAADLAAMQPSAVLINTSRGPIVDEPALIDALANRTIAGAGLDVYDREPLPAGHQLTTLDNVVLLPHLGYVSESGLRQMYGQVVEDIAAFLGGSPIRTIG